MGKKGCTSRKKVEKPGPTIEKREKRERGVAVPGRRGD